MLLSAEIRWFWDTEPRALHSWFVQLGIPPGGGGTRIDEYLDEDLQKELGVKRRGSKPGVEVKGLLEVDQDSNRVGAFAGHIQFWAKWNSTSLTLPRTIFVEKRRLLRKLDLSQSDPCEIELGDEELPVDPNQVLPTVGCNVEFTELNVNISKKTWWTLGFEAFGPRDNLKVSLLRTLNYFSNKLPPELTGSAEMSYPGWLAAHF